MEEVNKNENVTKLKEKFEEFKIIPDILSKAPDESILILFQSGVKVNFGNLISFYQSRRSPYLFYWPVANFDTLYSVLIIDVDVPSVSDPADRSYLIFLVANILANNIMKGEIVAEYEPLQPKAGTGQHRILILGFKQTSFIKIDTHLKEKETRMKFSLNDFVQKYNLDNPIVGNFYVCSG